LLLCVGVELDSGIAGCCSNLNADRRPAVTFSLSLAMLPNPHWSAISPSSPLRYWRLISVGKGESLVQSSLQVEERILHYLTGVSQLDERLEGLLKPIPFPKEMPE